MCNKYFIWSHSLILYEKNEAQRKHNVNVQPWVALRLKLKSIHSGSALLPINLNLIYLLQFPIEITKFNPSLILLYIYLERAAIFLYFIVHSPSMQRIQIFSDIQFLKYICHIQMTALVKTLFVKEMDWILPYLPKANCSACWSFPWGLLILAPLLP